MVIKVAKRVKLLLKEDGSYLLLEDLGRIIL